MKEISHRLPTGNPKERQLAKIIWENPFFSGLTKLKKADLIYIIENLLDALDFELNLEDPSIVDERKIKDIIWDQKCLLIESLDEKFFDRDS